MHDKVSLWIIACDAQGWNIGQWFQRGNVLPGEADTIWLRKYAHFVHIAKAERYAQLATVFGDLGQVVTQLFGCAKQSGHARSFDFGIVCLYSFAFALVVGPIALLARCTTIVG